MAQLVLDASTRGIAEKELMIKVPYCSKGGIKSWELVSCNVDRPLQCLTIHNSDGGGERDHR